MKFFLFIIAIVISSELEKRNAPWWMYALFVGPLIICVFQRDRKKAVEVPLPDAPDLEKIKAEIRSQLLRDLVEANKKLAQREVAVYQRENKLGQVEQTASSLKPGSIRLIRNTLMKLHEARRTDDAYQVSSTCKAANAILQGLNNLIEKKKGAA